MNNTVDEKYKGIIREVLTKGNKREDRTGTGTISTFGTRMEFDLQEGFPLLSLKKTKFELAFGELMWMAVDGSTDNKELRDNYGVNFWRHWVTQGEELPNIYGKQMVRNEGEKRVVKLKPRVEEFKPYTFPIQELLEYNKDNEDDMVGKTLKNNKGQEFMVLDSYMKEKRRLLKVQFLRTGSIREYRKHTIQSVKDLYEPTVYGVGFLGGSKGEDEESKKLYSTWQSMLERCYSENHPAYDHYGGAGVFVQGRWHNFSKFKEDVKHIPNWYYKKDNWGGYSLDKDYYGANCYSMDTCVWLSKQGQQLYRTNNNPFKVVNPRGVGEVFIERSHCREKTGLSKNQLHRKLNYPERIIEGFEDHKIEYIDSEGFLYRYQLPVNQIQRVLSELKNNPTSRRMIIDNWSAYDLEHQALPSCHAFVQFSVRGGKLDCQMNQRSVDVMLGLPYNIAFYSLLTHIMAHLSGLEVGRFIHIGGDTHIYNNLTDMANEVLNRSSQNNPTLEIIRDVEYLHEFKIDDFRIKGYTPHEHIKGNVSV